MYRKDEASKKQATTLTLGPKLKTWAENFCREHEKALSDLVSDLLRKYLEEQDPKGKLK